MQIFRINKHYTPLLIAAGVSPEFNSIFKKIYKKEKEQQVKEIAFKGLEKKMGNQDFSPAKMFSVFQHRQDIFTTGKIAHCRSGNVRNGDTRNRLKPDKPPQLLF